MYFSYRISICFLLYFPIICWKCQCCLYFTVYLNRITLMSFSDNSIIWNPYGSVSTIYCCLLWFRVTLSYLLKCLVSFDLVVDIVYKFYRNNFSPRQHYFPLQRICFAFARCLGIIILRKLQSNSGLRWSKVELQSLLDHFYFWFTLIPRVQPLWLNSQKVCTLAYTTSRTLTSTSYP